MKDSPETAGERMAANGECNTFWGSHGCDLKAGHTGLHVCSPGELDEDPSVAPGDCSSASTGDPRLFSLD